jgi:hypothetical protein
MLASRTWAVPRSGLMREVGDVAHVVAGSSAATSFPPATSGTRTEGCPTRSRTTSGSPAGRRASIEMTRREAHWSSSLGSQLPDRRPTHAPQS